MPPKTRAWLVAALVALFNLAYPLSVALRLPQAESERWIKNDPTFNVFMTLIFFFVVGVFLASADFRPIQSLGRFKSASFSILAVLLLLSTFAVLSTFDRPLLEPFLFKNSRAALEKEIQIRATIRKAHRNLDKIHDEAELKVAKEALDQARTNAIESYKAEFPALETFGDLRSRGSFCAWLALAVNGIAGLFAAIVFWYLWNIVLFRRFFKVGSEEWIVLVVGLLTSWFPLRLYAEWYIGFYSFETMKGYNVFLFLGLVAVSSYAFCVFRLAKSLSVKIFSAIGTGILGLIGLIGKLQPRLLGAAVSIFEDMPFKWYVASMAIIVLALGAMVFSLLGTAAPSVVSKNSGTKRSKRRRGDIEK